MDDCNYKAKVTGKTRTHAPRASSRATNQCDNRPISSSKRAQNNIIFSVNIQIDRAQNDYKNIMNRWSQIITGVEFSCTTAMQGAHHTIHLILPMLFGGIELGCFELDASVLSTTLRTPSISPMYYRSPIGQLIYLPPRKLPSSAKNLHRLRTAKGWSHYVKLTWLTFA